MVENLSAGRIHRIEEYPLIEGFPSTDEWKWVIKRSCG